MPAPTRPPTMSAVSTGPSSRTSDSDTTLPTYSLAPKRAICTANCTVITMLENTAVSTTTDSER